MHEANRASHRIYQINRTAIGDVNAETNAALICDQTITIRKAFVRGHGLVDHRDILSMHLLRGYERRGVQSFPASNFSVNTIQPRQRFRFVLRHFETGHSQGETVRDLWQRAERAKLFSRKLTFAHLLPVVVRVRVVVVLCWTGGRLPARFSSSGPGFGAGVGLASVFNLLRVNGSSSSFE